MTLSDLRTGATVRTLRPSLCNAKTIDSCQLAEDYAPTIDIRVNGYNHRFQGQCKALQNHVVRRSHVQSAVDVDLLCCCGFIGLSLLISVCLRYTVWAST